MQDFSWGVEIIPIHSQQKLSPKQKQFPRNLILTIRKIIEMINSKVASRIIF